MEDKLAPKWLVNMGSNTTEVSMAGRTYSTVVQSPITPSATSTTTAPAEKPLIDVRMKETANKQIWSACASTTAEVVQHEMCQKTSAGSTSHETTSTSNKILANTVQLAEVRKIIDSILGLSYLYGLECYVYIVRLKEDFNGHRLVRITKAAMKKFFNHLVEEFDNNFHFHHKKLKLTESLIRNIVLDAIITKGSLLADGVSYLLKFQNTTPDTKFWISSEEVMRYYPNELVQFNRLFDFLHETAVFLVQEDLNLEDDSRFDAAMQDTQKTAYMYKKV